MSAKAQLLSTMAIVAVVGIAVIVIGVSEGGGLGTWIAVIGVLTVMLAGVGAIETMRWLRPSTRLGALEELGAGCSLAAIPDHAATTRWHPHCVRRDSTRRLCPATQVGPRASTPARSRS